MQTTEVQARYPARHTAETIKFFGIKPGMTVVETLPGGPCPAAVGESNRMTLRLSKPK